MKLTVFASFCIIGLTTDINYAHILLIHVTERSFDSTDQLSDLVRLALYIDRFQINDIIQRPEGAVWIIHFRTTRDDLLSMRIVKALPNRIYTVYHGMVKMEPYICVTICQLIPER